MSQPRRRRRKRRKSGQGGEQPKRQDAAQASSTRAGDKGQRSRRRRGRRRGNRDAQGTSPKSSEDLVRALPKPRPATLTAPPDGQTLENLIPELQSEWGVPQYPQEYRITIKVAEEREGRGDGSNGNNAPSKKETAPPRPSGGGPVREKAPAAPLMRSVSDGGEGEREQRGGKRKRNRGRRRRGRGGGSGGGNGNQSQGDVPRGNGSEGSNGGGAPSS